MLAKNGLRYFSLLAIGVLLSTLTVVLGALPMRVVRRVYGRLPFWSGHLIASAILVATGLPLYGAIVFALAVMVGAYDELEQHGGSVFTSGTVAVLAAVGSAAVGVGLWLFETKAHLVDELRNQVIPVVESLKAMNTNVVVDVSTVLQQLPSGIVIALTIALAVALVGESRLRRLFGLPEENMYQKDRLTEFRAPDATVWLVVVAIFGAFFRHGNVMAEAVSINVINVLMVVYFFQGLAIATHAFRVFKISPFWQSIWYVLLILQLFLMVSLIGFADYWLDFRERLSRKPAESKKSF